MQPALQPDLCSRLCELELDLERFLDDLDDPTCLARVQQDVASAEASGAPGTPTFFVGTRRHVGAYDARSLAQALRGQPGAR